jgi:hypothetical protein
MSITTSDADRDVGVVYLDPGLQVSPSTHALIIGVGQYASNRLPPVSSPPIAARAMTEWFLDGALGRGSNGFKNPRKPLCSLGVLLSELPQGTLSDVEGAGVPRATFVNVKKAVRSWVARARAHSENLLFLFISSHGESFGRRTAFLLEDYGMDQDDVTAGMSEIEQFVESLSNVDPEQQLLIFDCCRTPTSLGLRFDQEFGARLINPAAASGLPARRPHVLRSTGLGTEAYGRKDAPTLFAQALLDSLKGLAASPNDGWTVDTHGLGHIAARLLGLHIRDGQALQQPESQLSTPFVISVAAPTDNATVFVSLAPEHDFSTSRIRVMDGQALIEEVIGAARLPPFARLELPKYQARTIKALDAAGGTIGETRIEPLPPVAFRELPERLSVTRSSGDRSLDVDLGKERIVLSVASTDTPTLASVVATLNRRGEDTDSAKTVVLSADKSETTIEIAPGWYTIDLAIANGRTRSIEAEVKPGTTVDVKLDLSGTPRDLSEIELADLSDFKLGRATEVWEPAARAWLQELGASKEKIMALGPPGGMVLTAPIPFLLGLPGHSPRAADNNNVQALALGAINRTHNGLTIAINDTETRRLPGRLGPRPLAPELADRPAWAAIIGPGWREIVAVPSLGVSGKYLYDAQGVADPWTPELIVDALAGTTASHVTSVARTRQWSGLLDFLTLRDFKRSAIVLDGLMTEVAIRSALVEKVENPLVATAGALVALASGRIDQAQIPEQWFWNLANWFPGLADGPVIVARLLLSQKDFATRRAAAKTQLLDAYRRGIPVYSLAVDWLAQGLDAFGDDPDTSEPASNARRVAQLSDPTRAFTVLRIPV